MIETEVNLESIPTIGEDDDDVWHSFFNMNDEYALCGHRFITGQVLPAVELLESQLCEVCEKLIAELGYPSQ